jgi:copper oxidase (laccase) domain-containing protein
MLSEQAQIDEQLQLSKKWFANTAKSEDWNLLQELLAQRWREMSSEEIQDEFSIALEEEDPFYSYRPDQY